MAEDTLQPIYRLNIIINSNFFLRSNSQKKPQVPYLQPYLTTAKLVSQQLRAQFCILIVRLALEMFQIPPSMPKTEAAEVILGYKPQVRLQKPLIKCCKLPVGHFHKMSQLLTEPQSLPTRCQVYFTILCYKYISQKRRMV